MTIRETCFPLFFYLALVIHPADRHFERSEKSFSSPFSHDSFTKPFTGSTVPPFLRYGVSHSLLSDTRRLTANEKDPSASLGMTLREYRSLTLPIYFPCNNDTREAPSTFAALLFFMRRTTPLNPTT